MRNITLAVTVLRSLKKK